MEELIKFLEQKKHEAETTIFRLQGSILGYENAISKTKEILAAKKLATEKLVTPPMPVILTPGAKEKLAATRSRIRDSKRDMQIP